MEDRQTLVFDLCARQLEILSNGIFANGELPTFVSKIKEKKQFPLRPKKLEILQINLGDRKSVV